MNTRSQVPRTPRRQLGAELRRLRVLAGISGRELAQRTGMSQSKVSRIERGDAIASIPELTQWLERSAAIDRLEDLIAATEAALNESDSWNDYQRTATFEEMQQQVQQRELTARTQRSFLPTLVPGLLQTAEYARLVFTAADLTGQQDHAAAVQRRLDRQRLLYDPSHTFDFVLTEAALRWRPGAPGVLIAQLDRIASLATLTNVTIGVVPMDAGTRAIPWHGFTLNEDVDDGEPFVQVETIHAYLTVARPDDVELYRRHFAVLREAALTRDDLAAFLATLRTELVSQAR